MSHTSTPVTGRLPSVPAGLVSLSLFALGCDAPEDHDHDHAAQDAQGYSQAYDELLIGKADGGCKLNGEATNLAWVGDTCEGDDDCNMGGSHRGLCDQPEGSTATACTIECDGFCPDRGSETTFCVSLDGGESGTCVLKATADNDNCGDFEHLAADERDRFIGNSTASASTSRVCLPC